MAEETQHKILVVEDDTFLLKVYLDRLKDEGFEVAVATNGEEGISMAEQQQPDVILLDMILPRMSGFDFLEEAAKHEKMNGIPILVMSNLGQDDDIKTAKELGAKDYLVKADTPFASILETIKKHLS